MKMRNYLALDSFNAPIAPFYSMSEMPEELPTRHVYDPKPGDVINEVLACYNLPPHSGWGF